MNEWMNEHWMRHWMKSNQVGCFCLVLPGTVWPTSLQNSRPTFGTISSGPTLDVMKTLSWYFAFFPVFDLINVLWITHHHPQLVKTMEKQMASSIYVERGVSPKSQDISNGSLSHWLPPQLSKKGLTFHGIQQYPCQFWEDSPLIDYPLGCAEDLKDGAKFPMPSALICISFPKEIT